MNQKNNELKYKFEVLRKKALYNIEYSLGYPVNRTHAFKVDFKLMGVKKKSLATTYLNNIASPFYHGSYTSDNVKELEVEIIKMLEIHYNVPENDLFGYITYGGTEANFVSIWWHRKYLFKHTNIQPILVMSSNSHYSLKKIANQQQIEIIEIKADTAGLDYNHLEGVVLSLNKPIIYCANFGATTDGSIDDIEKIHFILKKSKCLFKIHADGAIYGLLIPYIKLIGKDYIFNYIDTLSFSAHKFLGTFNIIGVVLTNKNYINAVFANEDRKISYIQNAVDITSSGSRQGYYAVELFLLLNEAFKVKNGKTKLEILWNKCIKNVKWFYKELSKIVGKNNIDYFNNQLSILFPAPKIMENKQFLAKKYGLMPVGNDKLGVYVFPRSTRKKLHLFLKDYKDMMNE